MSRGFYEVEGRVGTVQEKYLFRIIQGKKLYYKRKLAKENRRMVVVGLAVRKGCIKGGGSRRNFYLLLQNEKTSCLKDVYRVLWTKGRRSNEEARILQAERRRSRGRPRKIVEGYKEGKENRS